MGAALRMDPTKVGVTEFWKVKNDPLGKALRKRFKSRGQMPSVKFKCVYSEELPMENRGTAGGSHLEDGWSGSKRRSTER
jgi:Dinucleotide-utilizing enzymes involved in molybdopterin and thiamine biosynthesis family 1